jgi:lysophospholipase L1-like esterase
VNSTGNAKLQGVLTFLFLGGMAAACLLAVNPDSMSRVREKLGFRQALPSSEEVLLGTLDAALQPADMSVPPGAVLFFGDGITRDPTVNNVTTNAAANFGMGLETTEGLLKRLPGYRCLKTASAVVLAIGINDLLERDNDSLIENYSKILAVIPTTIAVVVSAILPVEESLLPGDRQGKTSNKRITGINERLRALCSKDQRCVYVDAGPSLRDSRGALSQGYHVGDGLHLSSEGYGIIRQGQHGGHHLYHEGLQGKP